ncbi:hypothetical protein HDV02_004908 [Globomyces sp. JEL0801]|nr:hypothetical protein HDV02_004908 [Globomyces sp. JEL0801]
MGRRKTTSDVTTINPEPNQNQKIGKVLDIRGGGLFDCTADGVNYLLELPAAFKKLMWVKKGGYIIFELSTESQSSKIHGSIIHILFNQDIKHLKKLNKWPVEFTDVVDPVQDSDDSDNDDDDLFENTNRYAPSTDDEDY